MTPAKPKPPEEPKITVDDLRAKAEHIGDLAKTEAQNAVRQVAELEATRLVAYAAIGLAVVLSLAYYLGTRRGRG
jgi:hypothetical protein